MRLAIAVPVLLVVLSIGISCGARDGARSESTGMATAGGSSAPSPVVVLPGGSRIAVEVASDELTRAQGLMFRSSLGDDRGMLFVFRESAVYPFWMKNTLIPLDIIWIDKTGSIVDIARDVPPCKADPCPSYPPKAAARYVLELAAGQAAARGLGVGDRLVFEGLENIVAR
ncbi:MAG: DUF192 domain-containing protein [Thermoanaerobaculia bacterium]|nr:DUF192 domain-containing protein [Thermoanaerobaculia bacterium]